MRVDVYAHYFPVDFMNLFGRLAGTACIDHIPVLRAKFRTSAPSPTCRARSARTTPTASSTITRSSC